MTTTAPAAQTTAVILNWKDTEQTLACVKSVLVEVGVASVVVVDNESTGQLSAPLSDLEDPRIQLIEIKENRGFSGGVNVGLRAFMEGDSEFVLVINNDAVLESDSLNHLVAAMSANRSIYMVGPKIMNTDGSLQSSGGRMNNLTLRIDACSFPGRIDFLTWACVLLRRETIDTIGFLDERFFMYWEDVDYSKRIKHSNGGFEVVPEARVIHNISSSHDEAGPRVLAYSAYGLSALGCKYRVWIIGAVWRGAARVVKQIVRRNPATARAIAYGWIRGLRARAPAYAFAPHSDWPLRSADEIGRRS